MSFESEMKEKELAASIEKQRFNTKYMKDIVTKQYLLEQEEKKRRIEEATSQYFLDRELEREESESKTSQYLLEQELQRIEKSKSKKYADLDSSIEELLKKYPSLNLKDFSRILHQQSSEHFLQQTASKLNMSEEKLEELINKYFKDKNNQGRRR